MSGDSQLSERILYEDNHVLVVNKPVSVLVQGDKSGDTPLLELYRDFIRRRDSKPGNAFLGLVHRLDRPTSGALVLAKTSKALARLNNSFARSQVRKFYWALIDSLPPEMNGELKHFLIKNPNKNKSFAYDEDRRGSREARLNYRLVKSLARYHLLEVELLTGRHHQIRAQLAAVGVHIRGDLKYGARRSNPDGGISLHARKIIFPHPVGEKPVEVIADPRDVQDDTLWKNPDIYNTI